MTEETLRGWGFAKDKRESPSSRCLLCLETTVGQRGSQNVPCISSAAVLTAGLNCLGQKGGSLLLSPCLGCSWHGHHACSLAQIQKRVCPKPGPQARSAWLQSLPCTPAASNNYLPKTHWLPSWYRLACSGLCTLSQSSILNTPALSLPNSLKVHSKFQIGGLPWWFSG